MATVQAGSNEDSRTEPGYRVGLKSDAGSGPPPSYLSREFLIHHRLCPREQRPDGSLTVAVTTNSVLEGLEDLSLLYHRPIITESVSGSELDLLIARLTSGDEEKVALERTGGSPGPDDGFTRDVRDLANQAPVVRYVNLLIREATDAGASDIHLEATRHGMAIRFRIDGVLVPGLEAPPQLDRAVVSRIKLLADLDIADRRRPQDGRIRVRLNDRELDLRVSTIPTAFGENVVLRLLERGGCAVALSSLGLADELFESVRTLIERPSGMMLVTGPTGSGKTTTLYAALGLRNAASEKIVTLEDPVEYTLDGVSQVPVNAQTGLTFAAGLRSILRQDPDVILVGEMRDLETAELAVQAALTGHVVFSTLHTSDAIGAIPRLLDLGIAPFLISATIEGILAQRLVRRVCDQCREAYRPDPKALEILRAEGIAVGAIPEFTRGRGCPECRGAGYRGRLGLFELLRMSDDIRAEIGAGPSQSRLAKIAATQGMRSLRVSGWSHVEAGLTTVEEILRVTQD